MKPTILFIYDYFYPGFKAGGPIQSIVNMIGTIQDKYKCFVLTSAYDLNEKDPHSIVSIDQWNRVMLPGADSFTDVYYYDKKSYSISFYRKLLKSLKPDIIYINGIYTFPYIIIPLFETLQYSKLPCKYIVAPRGMLQPSSIVRKWFKKNLYFLALKLFGIPGKLYWHATDSNEAMDIANRFPENMGIITSSNIPKKPLQNISFLEKEAGKLSLVYLSLIAEKKNLHFVIDTIISLNNPNITLDVYGPSKDPGYFSLCMAKIKKSNGIIKYMGPIQPDDVQNKLQQYHALILLTKGENFSHAIYESLSVGRPVITSFFTPWVNLEQDGAGWNLNIKNIEAVKSGVSVIAALGNEEYSDHCVAASKRAIKYYSSHNFSEVYDEMFNQDTKHII